MAAIPRERLDLRLLALGLATSRERAQALILAGRVTVDGQPADKPGTPTRIDAVVRLSVAEHPYVGRGGLKLQGALTDFSVDPQGAVALDLGASTGGFTDCLLQHGARRVYAVDVGHGLLDLRLRDDPRVVLLERTNARTLDRAAVPEPIDLATADLAFISLRLVLPALRARLAPTGQALVLVKPQFELRRGEVGRGVVRDPAKHALAIHSVASAARTEGFSVRGVTPSPILGARGNREFFLQLAAIGADLGEALAEQIDLAVAARASGLAPNARAG